MSHAFTIIYIKAIIKESSVGWSTSVNIVDEEQFKKKYLRIGLLIDTFDF